MEDKTNHKRVRWLLHARVSVQYGLLLVKLQAAIGRGSSALVDE